MPDDSHSDPHNREDAGSAERALREDAAARQGHRSFGERGPVEDDIKAGPKLPVEQHQRTQQSVEDQIGRKEARRLRAKNQPHRNVWFGLGMFGLVGWSVTVPTVLGAAVGMWIDARWHGQQSWTLMLLIGGLIAGCLNAWRWVRNESEMR